MNSLLLRAGLMVLLLMAVGCSRKAVPTVVTEVKDSIYVKEVPRYVYIDVPGDTVEIEKMIECDPVTNKPTPFKDVKKKGRATLTLNVNASGVLTGTSSCDSLHQVIKAMDKEIYHLKHERKTETIVQTEFKTRDIDIFCRFITGGVLLTVIGYGALKYFKSSIPWKTS